ncbi:hypothetical protein E2986_06206 [Frieseomelitta varia]|uniref:Afadin n=1 Tax=Frieseomelitta varia TaxID=561572 RepID=A0A833S9N5_9HYME|nr:hypothetical protein E2986_06206 [Frieseomelitta varia]
MYRAFHLNVFSVAFGDMEKLYQRKNNGDIYDGSIMFHVRRRPSDYVPRKRKKKPSGKWNEVDYRYEDERLPFSLELNPDGNEIANGAGVRHRLQPNAAEMGSERSISIHPSSPSKSTSVPAAAVATVCHTRSPTHPPESTHNYETTFDLDGNVETASLTSSRDGNRTLQNDRQPRGMDPILPAVLEFLEETEETFFHAVITDVEPSAPQFKLAPTYTLYLAARYRASTHYRPELQPTERAHRLTVMLANVASMIQRVIQERYMDTSSLALWLANGSELLHMLKNDRHVGAFSTRAQDILTEAVHTAFASLVRCISLELAPAMSQFMADADEPAKEAGVLQIFSSTMALLRRCRVNAALTIQLFSHLFHTINATAFNALVSNANLCVRWFGRRLKARLNALETWAERQGLELASQCHLATIMQATHLLQAPKYNAEELATLSSTCFKLNSLQVRALLQKYQPAADEPRLPAELIENVVKVAESVADTLARADGREIRLEEEPTLALALLLPEDGYSCEVIRGVPPGLAEFLTPLQRDGLCRMAPQPTSSGYWTIYMIDHNNFRSPSAMSNRSGGYSCHAGPTGAQPEIHVIKLHKSTSGMGLSIVAAKGAGQDRLGIYIKSVVAGGAADADGRLTAGDQLLKVDGQSLVGITQEKAAEYLVRTGPIVTLEVAKQGAIYHGLATLLSQPSPVMTRGAAQGSTQVRELGSFFDGTGNERAAIYVAFDGQPSATTATTVKRDDLSLDSIPYIDQTVETPFPFHPSNKVDDYRSKGNDGAFDAVTNISPDDFVARSNLPRCNGDDVTIKRPRCSQRLMIEGSRIANEHREEELWDERQEKDDDAVEICTILRTTAKNGVDNAAIPVLNLDLSGLDGDTSGNVSSFGKYVGTDGKQQHEVFNPGYSRASSSNSVTPPVTQPPPPMTAINGSTSLRSRSSHNLHDPTKIGTLPPTGLVSRQQSSPNLNPGQTTSNNASSVNVGSSMLQGNEAERFYQNLSIYRNQDAPANTAKQRHSPSQHSDDRNPLQLQKNSRGSQNFLNRPGAFEINQTKDRPISAYVPQAQQQAYPVGGLSQQQNSAAPPRSQSSRDIIRQEAKLQEMQEEVRRRELRGGVPASLNQYRPNAYNLKTNMSVQSSVGSGVRPTKSIGSQPNLGSSPPVTVSSAPSISSNGMFLDYGRDQGIRDIGKLYVDQNQHVAVGSQYYLNANSDVRNEHYNDEGEMNRAQAASDGNTMSNEISIRSALAEEGFTESPPPPPPSTSTHPLYNKQTDSRYTASMQDPPRGGYYPANTSGAALQPRQYQYSASNPWQREEKEREQARRREAARQWRDQQIAELSALSHRTSQQEEQLRALQLERDFQKRAEEVANQQDDDEESNDLDTENIRIQQSLLRTTVAQDRNNSLDQHHLNLSRTNMINQSVKGSHTGQSTGTTSLMHSTNAATAHTINSSSQQYSQNVTNLQQQQSHQQQQQQQQDNSDSHLSSDFQHEHANQMANNIGQFQMSSLIHLTSSQKPLGLSQSNEEKEIHRRHEEIKRKQVEFDDAQSKKKEEEMNKQQQIQQMYQQQHHSQQLQSHLKTQQLLHPSMLRLDSLIINGSNASSTQNASNDAPLPPERGSSYAIMSQQSTLRSNNANISNIITLTQPQSTSIKKVSFHDSNANVESMQRNVSSGNSNTSQVSTMDVITEDPNNFINDAEILLASPKTPEGSSGTSITGSTPGVIGAQEVYKDPRQRRLAEKQKQQQSSQVGQVPEKLSFKEKMKMFAMETGEDGTPRDKNHTVVNANKDQKDQHGKGRERNLLYLM